MANMITRIRMICSIVLVFCPAFSVSFYMLYVLAGVTDVLDGIVARHFGCVSDFGSKLDTVADFIFCLVCFIKIIPVLKLERWMFIWIFVIALIKLINLISAYVVQKKFVACHSNLNKLTGALLFCLPLTLKVVDLRYSMVVIGIVATVAAIQEGHLIRKGLS
ncbi:CDP-alcohol phosphatidyltransferase family protein [uncultured Streptococcus sp.]|uniref:CDP-alcohol phosphatidyltransferase family protein n=1 Tax=uncultured Streptococcus sp. TaxID=83427 RepID=UPI00258C1F7B|nr:CDP-alcohol phosphatidyltransferase family protein [uncultured Streptococcus sp.]